MCMWITKLKLTFSLIVAVRRSNKTLPYRTFLTIAFWQNNPGVSIRFTKAINYFSINFRASATEYGNALCLSHLHRKKNNAWASYIYTRAPSIRNRTCQNPSTCCSHIRRACAAAFFFRGTSLSQEVTLIFLQLSRSAAMLERFGPRAQPNREMMEV